MPRPPRRIEANLIYHVLNRGNGRQRLFYKDEDFEAFLKIVTEGLDRFDVELFCWCLMGNHWHLVLRPRRENHLQRFMQWITLTHARRHHGQHGQTSGHLYQGRYKHFCVETDEYFLTLCRYVEANPSRAKLVKRAQDWRWSSLTRDLDSQTAPPLSEWPVDRPANWIRLVNRELSNPEMKALRECVNRQQPLGSAAWVKRMARRLQLEQTLRPRGRPMRPLATLSKRQARRRKKVVGQNGT